MLNDTVNITELLKSLPGASAGEITSVLWPFLSGDMLQEWEEHVASTLQQLESFGVITRESGWRLSPHDNPFKHIAEVVEGEGALAAAFCSLSIIYFGTGERRLAAAMGAFVADPSRDLERRRQVYICLLVLCKRSCDWPKRAKDIIIPADIDWKWLASFEE